MTKLTISQLNITQTIFLKLKGLFVNTSIHNIIYDATALSFDFDSTYKNRIISNLVEMLLEKYPSIMPEEPYKTISDDGLSILAGLIYQKYQKKWIDLLASYNYEYNPIKPFDITLTEKGTNDLITKKDKTTYTDNNDVYGFNSETAVHNDKDTGTTDREYERESPYTRDYTRQGNIGNISQQKLIEEQRRLLNDIILPKIYFDIATTLCRAKYN